MGEGGSPTEYLVNRAPGLVRRSRRSRSECAPNHEKDS